MPACLGVNSWAGYMQSGVEAHLPGRDGMKYVDAEWSTTSNGKHRPGVALLSGLAGRIEHSRPSCSSCGQMAIEQRILLAFHFDHSTHTTGISYPVVHLSAPHRHWMCLTLRPNAPVHDRAGAAAAVTSARNSQQAADTRVAAPWSRRGGPARGADRSFRAGGGTAPSFAAPCASLGPTAVRARTAATVSARAARYNPARATATAAWRSAPW